MPWRLSLDQQRPEGLNLNQDGPATGSTGGIATLDACLKVEHVLDVLGESGAHGLELGEREVRERDAGLLGESDAGPANVVRLAEGDL